MYAIIRAGGKQYKVKPGDVLRVEKFEGELGSELELTEVLMVGGEKLFVGEPTLAQATVTVVVTNQQRGPKLVIFKKKRRQGYRRMGGHRQPYTELFIKAITNPEGQTAKADSQAQVFSPEKKAQKVEKTKEVRLKAKQEKRSDKEEAAPARKAKATAKKKAPAKKKAVAKKKTAAKKKTTTTKKVAKKATKKVSKK
jgi:large subunit ribosomal protein L21